MADKIDISEHVSAICEAFGLVPKNVAEIHLEPSTATAVVYRTDENGSKYIEAESGRVAQDILEFAVKT